MAPRGTAREKLQPTSHLGVRCQALAEALAGQLDAAEAPARNGATAPLRDAVAAYFDFLADKKVRQDIDLGVAAEMSSALKGNLPIPAAPSTAPVGIRDLILDLSALFAWEYLLTEDTGKRYFYSWKKWREACWQRAKPPGAAADGKKFSEAGWVYQRDCPVLVGTTAFGNDRVVLELKGRLLHFVGDILVRHTKDADRPVRELNREQPLTPPDVLRLQVFALAGKPLAELEDRAAPAPDSLDAAVHLWAATSPLCEYLFQQWGWLAPVDFARPLNDAEKAACAARGGQLYRAWAAGTSPGGLARLRVVKDNQPPGSGVPAPGPWVSPPAPVPRPPRRRKAAAQDTPAAPPAVAPPAPAAEPAAPAAAPGAAAEADTRWLARPGERHAFEPVPFVLIGATSFGKSSYLCAAVERLKTEEAFHLNEEALRLKPGTDLLTFWKQWAPAWKKREPSRTDQYYRYELCAEPARSTTRRGGMWLRTMDYPGEYVEPWHFAAPIQAQLKGARGFFFFLDDRFFPRDGHAGDPDELYKTVHWYRSILEWWQDSNPDAAHVPIAIIINKAERVLGDGLAQARPTLIQEGAQRPLLHAGPLGRRVTGATAEPSRPVDRLRLCVTQDLANSRSAARKRLTWQLLDQFEEFFDRVQKTTYRYQIFLTTSVAERGKARQRHVPDLPYGTLEPLRWMAGELYGCFVPQAVEELQTVVGRLKKGVDNLDVKTKDVAERQEKFAKACKRRDDHLSRPPGLANQLFGQWTAEAKRLEEEVKRYEAELKAAAGEAMRLAGAAAGEAEGSVEEAAGAARELLARTQGPMQSQAEVLASWAEDLRSAAAP